MFSTEGLGSALRLLRVRRSMTQGEVAARAQVRQALLSAYEMGHQLPSLGSLAAILNALSEDFHHLQEALAEVRNPPPAMGSPVKPEYLGRALRTLRTQRGLTQVAVASEAKLTKSMLSTYETGRQLPSLQSLAAVLNGLKCDFHSLQEALLLELPESDRPQAERVPQIQTPAREAESEPESLGGLHGEPEAGGLHLRGEQGEPAAGGQALIVAFESVEEEGPSVYVQLHPALRSLNSGRAVVWIEVTGPG
jgi:transcriptional regulator with XRE-family HTH domain